MRTALMWVLVAMLVAGCQESGPPPQSSDRSGIPDSQASAGNGGPSTSAAADVKLQLLDWGGVQRLLASHRGKVVVLDCWSTSCDPCMKEFPGLVQLHRRHGQRVACVSLSVDYEGIGKPEDVQERVLTFLQQQQATFDNVLCTDESDTVFEKLNFFGPPLVVVYDALGQEVKRFEGAEAEEGVYTQVAALVDELLAASGQ
jgi:thiol-disulfide isomerase/thioredoxin